MSKAQYRLPLWALKVATRLSSRDTGVSEDLKAQVSAHGCIFIHIPKCAGNAVQKSLFGDIIFGHQTIRQYQLALPASVYRKVWKFTVTRDPWERIVSAWRFLRAGGLHENDQKYFAETLGQYASFDHFVNDWLVYQDLGQCGCVHFKPQLHYIRNFKGEIAMDYMVKLSDLAGGYSHIKEKVGGGELMVDNQTKGEDVDWRQYYGSEETLENVSRVYEEDIQVLGYSPE